MNVLTLSGKTQKGKNRVREHGSKWIVLEERGSSLLIAAENDTPELGRILPNSARWVEKINDPDFNIICT